MKVELVLAGVGGQGVLLMAEALGTAAVASGLNARVSDCLLYTSPSPRD